MLQFKSVFHITWLSFYYFQVEKKVITVTERLSTVMSKTALCLVIYVVISIQKKIPQALAETTSPIGSTTFTLKSENLPFYYKFNLVISNYMFEFISGAKSAKKSVQIRLY